MVLPSPGQRCSGPLEYLTGNGRELSGGLLECGLTQLRPTGWERRRVPTKNPEARGWCGTTGEAAPRKTIKIGTAGVVHTSLSGVKSYD